MFLSSLLALHLVVVGDEVVAVLFVLLVVVFFIFEYGVSLVVTVLVMSMFCLCTLLVVPVDAVCNLLGFTCFFCGVVRFSPVVTSKWLLSLTWHPIQTPRRSGGMTRAAGSRKMLVNAIPTAGLHRNRAKMLMEGEEERLKRKQSGSLPGGQPRSSGAKYMSVLLTRPTHSLLYPLLYGVHMSSMLHF